MQKYNNERTHSGKYCFGKTPMQTFIDSIPMAQEKLLERLAEDQLLSHTPQSDEIKDVSGEFAQNKLNSQNQSDNF